jgi:hypothetical protein
VVTAKERDSWEKYKRFKARKDLEFAQLEVEMAVHKANIAQEFAKTELLMAGDDVAKYPEPESKGTSPGEEADLVRFAEGSARFAAEIASDEPQSRRATEPTLQFDHTSDYRCICFRGTPYSLTHNQAIIVKILHEACPRRFPEVAKRKLLEGIQSETSRVRDSFKGSPLWGTLVMGGSKKGFYRLNLAETHR